MEESNKEYRNHLVSKVSMVVENAGELVDLIEKAQQQSAELKKTLSSIEYWNPNLKIDESISNLNIHITH